MMSAAPITASVMTAGYIMAMALTALRAALALAGDSSSQLQYRKDRRSERPTTGSSG